MKKTPRHPWFGQGSELGFAVNGVEGGVLRLKVGCLTLIEHTSDDHPLMLVDDANQDLLTDPITRPTEVRFDRPVRGWFRCTRHDLMGGRFEVSS